MGQVGKSSYFASANDVFMTTITKLKLQVVFLHRWTWVGLTHGLGWIGLGLGPNFSFFNGLGWVHLKNDIFIHTLYILVYLLRTS